MSHASTNETVMDNTGRGAHKVPGFGGIPVHYELKCEDRFAHGANDWKQEPAVTAGEFAMVAAMNTLTEPEWQANIFDEKIAAGWREEAFSTTPLMSEKAWTWCLAELRDKAVYFKNNQYIRVLDTGSCICKSDTLVPESLGSEFRSGIAPLLEQQDRDWQPKSNERAYYLLYQQPTSYSYRSIEKLISLAIKPWNDCLIHGQQGWEDGWNHKQRGPVPLRIITYSIEWENERPEWALAFHIPSPGRIAKYQIAKEILKNTTESEIGESKEKRLKAQKLVDGMSEIKGRENVKRPTPDLWRMAKEYLELPDNGTTSPGQVPNDWTENEPITWSYILRKHKPLMYFNHPEPGTAFSYKDWKAGNNTKAVVGMVSERPVSTRFPEGTFCTVNPDHKPYAITLHDTFRKQGLQIIVNIHGIELTPENLRYPGGNWQLEGQKNEHIVATPMYSYDVMNVTETRISFRQETPIHEVLYRYATHRYMKENYNMFNPPAHRYGKQWYEVQALAEILGFEDRHLLKESHDPTNDDILPFQNIGSVYMTQGRLIAFPHTMEHRVEPFELVDPSVPEYHRFVVLYLVDQHYRVCSTRNVPPQQFHWWAEAVSHEFLKFGVPREISAEITSRTDDLLMGMDEARKQAGNDERAPLDGCGER